MNQLPNTPRALRISAAIGAVVWIGFRVLPASTPQVVDRVLALAVLVIAPLALAFHRPGSRLARRVFGTTLVLQPVCAAFVIASLLQVGPGDTAGALAAPWLALAAASGLLGLLLLKDAQKRSAPILCEAFALLYLPIGAVWLCSSRLGYPLMDFNLTIVGLTAAHFHYAGLAAPMIAALAGRHLLSLHPRFDRPYLLTAAAVVIGQPIVAVGITASAPVALAGAILLACGLYVLGALMLLGAARDIRPASARILMAISAVSVLLSMPLAVMWSVGDVTGDHVMDLDWTIRTHGMANAHGFSMCGLLAWTFARDSEPLDREIVDRSSG